MAAAKGNQYALGNTGGRPSTKTPDLLDIICKRLSLGESLRSVCKDAGMPDQTTIFKWLREDKEFSQQYARAKEEAADSLVDEMLEIADDEPLEAVVVDGVPLVIEGEMVKKASAASVNHARLKIDTRKWCASKLKPKKYGEKVSTEVTGKDGKDLIPEVDSTDLARKIAFTLSKGMNKE